MAGTLGVVAILAGLASARLNAPLLLVFLVLGMLAGEDGPLAIPFDDFQLSYFIGSLALAIILFEGGLQTKPAALRKAGLPALALATVGVALTAGVVGAAASALFGLPWPAALLVGAVLAPTDAAAVATLLSRARLALPERVTAVLEIESGLNDPMSVFLTLLLIALITAPGDIDAAQAGLLFARQMGLGGVIGLAGGFGLLLVLRRLVLDAALAPVLVMSSVLAVFGLAQSVHASGFLAVYLMGIIADSRPHPAAKPVRASFATFAWMAQIALFLLLGLLVTPHLLVPLAGPVLAIAAVLILVARPVGVFVCLLPFGFGWRACAFSSWVGLRGAVPIYLAIVPVLSGVPNGGLLFAATFGVVIASLVIQGWTIGLAARLLGFGPATPP